MANKQHKNIFKTVRIQNWITNSRHKSSTHLLGRRVMEMFIIFQLVSIFMFVRARDDALISNFVWQSVSLEISIIIIITKCVNGALSHESKSHYVRLINLSVLLF